MSKMFQCYGIGQALIPVLPPPLKFESAPTVNQTNYEVGQVVYTGTPGNYTFYIYSGAGVWEILESSSGNLSTLTTDDSTVVIPTAGNINLKGAGSITTVGSGSNATVELSGLTNHTVLVGSGTTTITKVGPGSSGQVLQSGGASADPAYSTATYPATATGTGTILRSDGTNWVASTATYPNTAAAGDLIAATAANVLGSIADVATGQVLMSGGVGVIPAYSGSPSVSGSLTAGTTITATLGNITATAGNFVSSTAGNGLNFNATAASGATPVVLDSRAGAVTFTGISIAAAADLTLTMTNSAITGASTQVILSMSGSTTGSAPSIKSVTPSAGSLAIVVTNGTGATTTTADITFTFIVVN